MTQIRLNAARMLTSAISIALLALAPAAHADALQDISKQIKQGQHAQALEQIDKYLAGKPKDAQGRFLKGICLLYTSPSPRDRTRSRMPSSA